LVPLRDMKGQAKGVVFCSNRIVGDIREQFRPFTYDDVAIVESIAQAFAPQMDVLLAEQKRIVRLTKLAHELRVPIVAFNGALVRLRRESQQNRWVYQYDYLQNIAAYSDVMARLLKELELLRVGPDRIVLSASRPVLLYAAVIAPAVRFIRQELLQRNFKSEQIQKIEGLDSIPAVYVDPALMTQVVFNLLLNAIKYFGEKRHPGDFWLKIEGRRVRGSFEISFKDLGVGVPDGFEETIFENGVRAPNARFDQTGDGLGLWIASELVRRHGGKIFLRQNRGPTEFVISLPETLALYPPDPPA
jgi:signal transduction histidine kinase